MNQHLEQHCPEFNLLRCVQNTTSNSPCDHILLKDSTYRTLNPDTFKYNNSSQPCHSLCSFNTSTNTNPISNNNNNNKYNTISDIHNPLTNDLIIDMNSSIMNDNPYTLLKTSDIKHFNNKELIYQPLYTNSLKQYCITPILYKHDNIEENKK
ncbi:unnamed protein product [Schistosoma mattheei]|uniref:Uncharacterized protein n=1 Tax=Schistosoma mattheei TaxID=31246 RepID=A0A183PKJ9_9TREM|nr:unnamed protein product [Schistosoma mattheei]